MGTERQPIRLVLTAEARADLLEATNWYNEQAGLGNMLLAELASVFQSIESGDAKPSRVHYYRGRHEVRRIPLKRFRYAVVLQIRSDSIRVVAVAHGSRRPGC